MTIFLLYVVSGECNKKFHVKFRFISAEETPTQAYVIFPIILWKQNDLWGV
jgi:hypothetical protein